MTKNILVNTIDAFAKAGEASTGNPAGFVLGEVLTEAQMRHVAEAVGFSETAFVTDCRNEVGAKVDFKVRFFTPNEEVDLCGHATIGLFSGLYQLGNLKAGQWVQETKAGVLRVNVEEDGTVLMEQAAPEMTEIIGGGTAAGAVTIDSVAASLGLKPEDLHGTLPCQIVSTGLRDLLIPVKDVIALERIITDDKAISDISEKLNITGYHVFALTGADSARCRNFAPLYAIPEEAATGTSNGALTAYLAHYLKQSDHFTFIQGVEMGIPSQIHTTIDQAGRIWVGGAACHLGEKVVSL